MPRRTRKKLTRRKRQRQTNPFRPVPFRMVLDQHMFKLKYSQTNLASTPGGVIQGGVNANNFSGALDYANITAMFDEYKVLSCKLHYFPLYNAAVPGVATVAPFYIVNDYDDYATPGSSSEMIQYDNVRVVDLMKRFTHTMKFSSKASVSTLNRAGWTDLSAPQNIGGIKYFADNLTVSNTYGTYYIEFLVVVRGRR